MEASFGSLANTSGKASLGSGVQTCSHCRKAARDTREVISNGLKLIRIRFGLPSSELPDLGPSDLNRYLSFLLLVGRSRPSVSFPRRQVKGDGVFVDLQRLWKRERWEFAHSVASVKRNLPKGCRFHTPSARTAWTACAFSNPPPPEDTYLRFVRKNVSRLFPYGWDRKYADFVWQHVPNASARMNRRRADVNWLGLGEVFRRQCLTGHSVPFEEPVKARYKEVQSAGKCRPLVIFDDTVEILGPLHKLMFNHLSKTDWLLVGPPTAQKISSVCRFSHHTSVDLVNATDNLSLETTEAILGTLLRKSTLIPGAVKLRAFQSLRPLVDLDGEEREVSHGQMMGSYLSFPLLCLHSYLAALWALGKREGSILVNGDDTLVSSSSYLDPSSYPAGYQLNDKKTIRSQNVVEINSTAFVRAAKGKWREIRHLRRGGFLTDFPGMLHGAAAVRRDVKWTDAFIQSRIGKRWGFLPSQLGLRPESYPAFCRERTMWWRSYTALPEPPKEATTLLLAVRRQLDPDEHVAMTCHQFDNGREGGGKRDVFSPSIGEVRRGFSSKRKRSVYKLSYLSMLASLKLKGRGDEEELRFVPSTYVSKREDDAIKLLAPYREVVKA